MRRNWSRWIWPVVVGLSVLLRLAKVVQIEMAAPPEEDDFEVFVEEAALMKSRTGTAFAFDGDGRWFTAAHVTDVCDRVEVRTSAGDWSAAQVANPKKEDLAILRIAHQSRRLRLATDEPPATDGTMLGFPKGRFVALPARFLGFGVAHRYRGEPTAIRWSDRVAVWALAGEPADLLVLGGISGGPVLDPHGRAVGMLTTIHPRRGRAYAIPAATLRAAAEQDPPAPGSPGTDAVPAGQRDAAQVLAAAQSAVAPVRCHLAKPRLRSRF